MIKNNFQLCGNGKDSREKRAAKTKEPDHVNHQEIEILTLHSMHEHSDKSCRKGLSCECDS